MDERTSRFVPPARDVHGLWWDIPFEGGNVFGHNRQAGWALIVFLGLVAACAGSAGADDAEMSASASTALVDQGAVMDAEAGAGVGVFVELLGEGRWHVWWTCDSERSREACHYAIRLRAPSGEPVRVNATSRERLTLRYDDRDLVVTATTGSEVHELVVEAGENDGIEVAASVNGVVDGRYVFFVSNGHVRNGPISSAAVRMMPRAR